MISLALKMLIGNRASCIGVIFGIFLATLLISQQSAIFLGLVARSYRMVTDIPAPNLWVMDPVTESEDKLRTLPIGYVDAVRSVPGVEWAVPFSVSRSSIVTPNGIFDLCQLYGIDDASLIGAPTNIIEGNLLELRRSGAVIVDEFSARGVLARRMPNGDTVPLKVGDSLEINNHQATVVGICQITQGFYPQPILFTTITQIKTFDPAMASRIAFILTKTDPKVDVNAVIKSINAQSGLEALTSDQFKSKVTDFFLKTGILINFGLSVALGIIIGFSIAGQIFYIMTLENIQYYALIKAIGGQRGILMKMVLVQAAVVGIIGFALGIGATILWGMAIKSTSLAFLFPWQLLVFSAAIVFIICVFTAGLSIQKVFRIDPKALLGN